MTVINMKIPFNKPYSSEKEIEYITDAINRGEISGDGYYTNLVSTMLKENSGAKEVFLTTSATHALEMAAMVIDLKDGDEVIMPSFTFPSTANSVLLKGAKPVFAEIYEDTLNMNIEDLEKKITERTKAVIPVHYGGISCKMDSIMAIAEKNNLYVIEDAAQGVHAKYQGRELGTWGHFGCYSFHGTKNYSSGEGGALLINTDCPNIIERADIIRQKGTNRTRFNKGEIEQYMWVDVGSSYLPSDILMAFLYAQLSNMEQITMKRKCIYDYYSHHLAKFEEGGLIRLPHLPACCQPNYHIYYIVFNNKKNRDYALSKLRTKGINAATHFFPLHSSPMGSKLGYEISDLPITQSISERQMRLPIYPSISVPQLEYIVGNLEEILNDMKGL